MYLSLTSGARSIIFLEYFQKLSHDFQNKLQQAVIVSSKL